MKTIMTYKSDKELKKRKGERVISLRQLKGMLDAFKLMGLKDNSDCLIFDKQLISFRVVGDQFSYSVVKDDKPKKKIKQKKWDKRVPEIGGYDPELDGE